MEAIYWNTEEAHPDNNATMCDYLDNVNMLDITFVDGAYAEGTNCKGEKYEIHVSGNGDCFNHKAEFKLIKYTVLRRVRVTKQIKELNNVAVKPKTAEEEKMIIALFESSRLKNSMDLRTGVYIGTVDCSDYFSTYSDPGEYLMNIATLDQLIWDYGINPEWAQLLMMHPDGVICWHDGISRFRSLDNKSSISSCTGVSNFKLISTRPQETQEYMPEVGEECRYETSYFTSPKSKRGTCKPIAYHEMNGLNFVWLDFGEMDAVINLNVIKFKPLQTKQEIEREEFVKTCQEFTKNEVYIDRAWLFGELYNHLKENNLLVDKN